MKKILFFSLLYAASIILISPTVQAYEGDNTSSYSQNIRERSYSQIVGRKAANGFTNIGTAILEVPKNIINTTNESNLLFGLTGGTIKGLLHMMGRMGAGITDATTMLFPTQPILEPTYPWEDFDKETQYKPIFRYDSGRKEPNTTQ
ncbi:MAG: exosortase system-associated protein, TIGR04073 family [Methylococcales bacterium]|nr:exosortase system-associated protein, TIGR04073 family [Methylococcales bacterium]MCK5926065.1 exosortase system-associated protein, TIGR04073 family [Methylococcales bacterium]